MIFLNDKKIVSEFSMISEVQAPSRKPLKLLKPLKPLEPLKLPITNHHNKLKH